MSHENVFAGASGLTLKGKVFYNNSGSMAQRGSNFDLTEFGTNGLYTGGKVTGQVASDIVLAYISTNLTDPIGAGEYIPAVTVNNLSDVVSGTLDGTIEGTLTLQQAISVLVALAAGKCDGGATATIHFRNQADDTDRITLVVDAEGDRSATTIDVSDL